MSERGPSIDSLPLFAQPMPDHDGDTYESQRDKVRLNEQQLRVFEAMQDGAWRTLGEISEATGDPEASVSARLRDLRKPKFGGFTVERRYVGQGLWAYRLLAFTRGEG